MLTPSLLREQRVSRLDAPTAKSRRSVRVTRVRDAPLGTKSVNCRMPSFTKGLPMSRRELQARALFCKPVEGWGCYDLHSTLPSHNMR